MFFATSSQKCKQNLFAKMSSTLTQKTYMTGSRQIKLVIWNIACYSGIDLIWNHENVCVRRVCHCPVLLWRGVHWDTLYIILCVKVVPIYTECAGWVKSIYIIQQLKVNRHTCTPVARADCTRTHELSWTHAHTHMYCELPTFGFTHHLQCVSESWCHRNIPSSKITIIPLLRRHWPIINANIS